MGFVIESDAEGNYHLDRESTYARAVDLDPAEAAVVRVAAGSLLEDASFPFAADLRLAVAKITAEEAGASDATIARIADEDPAAQGGTALLLTEAATARKCVALRLHELSGRVRAASRSSPTGCSSTTAAGISSGETSPSQRYAPTRSLVWRSRRQSRGPEVAGLRAAGRLRRRALGQSAVPVRADVNQFEATLAFSPAVSWRAAALARGHGRLEADRTGASTWRVRARRPDRLMRFVIEAGPGVDLVAPAEVVEPPARAACPGGERACLGPGPPAASGRDAWSHCSATSGATSATLSELAELLGTTEQELTDDLTTLSLCGVAPYYPNDYVPVIVEDGFVEVFGDLPALSGPVRLSSAEARALAAALEAAGFSSSDDLTARLLDAAAGAGFDAAELERTVRAAASEHDRDIFESVAQALDERLVLRIAYQGAADAQPRSRDVEPLSLFAERGVWYLTAWCRDAMAWRTFRVDRIRSAEDDRRAQRPVIARRPADCLRSRSPGCLRPPCASRRASRSTSASGPAGAYSSRRRTAPPSSRYRSPAPLGWPAGSSPGRAPSRCSRPRRCASRSPSWRARSSTTRARRRSARRSGRRACQSADARRRRPAEPRETRVRRGVS